MNNQLSKETVFPSTRALLEAGISCRESTGKGWAIYFMEYGAEITLFPGDEGPQEATSIDEVIEWIGGDQPCVLTPASLERFGVPSNSRHKRRDWQKLYKEQKAEQEDTQEALQAARKALSLLAKHGIIPACASK